jgi:tRNA A-37 threonylcarbamoyl transferase component Bud32
MLGLSWRCAQQVQGGAANQEPDDGDNANGLDRVRSGGVRVGSSSSFRLGLGSALGLRLHHGGRGRFEAGGLGPHGLNYHGAPISSTVEAFAPSLSPDARVRLSSTGILHDDGAVSGAFGPYLIIETLARGGMGEVHLARLRDGAADGWCVLKTLRAELSRDRESVGRFVDEARVAVTLHHPNICRTFDVGRVGDQHYLAMEYVAGRDLRALLARSARQPLPAQVAIHVILEVLVALGYAHQHTHPQTGEALHIVHRDVSPHNVMVGFDGVVKLIDFGLAASRLKIEKTEPDVVLGKMAYMSPEQARGEDIDARADIFAAGVMLYELLVGERFYGRLVAGDVWRLAGHGGFRPVGLGQLDEELAAIIDRALQPAARRYRTCAEMHAALGGVAARFPAVDMRRAMGERFADEMVVEEERAQTAVHAPIADPDATMTQRVSLLESSDDAVVGDEAGEVVHVGPGVRGVARVPAPGVVHVVLRGHGDEAAGVWQRLMVDQEFTNGADHVYFFSDVEDLASHDTVFREQMTQWQARVKGRVTQLVLFRSKLVVMAISVANALSGGGTQVTSSRARFEVALAEAVTKARGGAIR